MQSRLLTYRRLLIVGVHLGLWTAGFLGAFLLRFEFTIPAPYFPAIWLWLAALLVARTVAFGSFGLFHGMWRYTGTRDLSSLFKAATISTVVFAVFLQLGGFRAFPRSIVIIDWLAGIFVVGGLRFGIRALRELASSTTRASEVKKTILIVGAGDAGEMLLRELQKNQAARFEPVGFVDDNPAKQGARIHGVSVLGPIADVPELVKRHAVEEVVIAIPTASGAQMRSIVEACKNSGAQVRTIPGLDHLIDGKVTVQQIRPVAIEDLLGRDAVKLDQEALAGIIRGRVVFVTGAGGSIGSELCRQLCRFQPAQLVLVERTENALFHVHRELLARFPEVALVPAIADVTDAARMTHLFSKHKPSLVLHAAAHKHVPMMEWNPGEAIDNNVRGTRMLADLADRFAVERFVMISTDKAVNPTSVMGATKRVAEMYVQALSQKSRTRFVTVRFGNVLGSAGSVIPIFQEQIARGGPVMVTHPDMRRYFMTIPEASQLVLQAGAMGLGGEIFILEMGEPVKIVDLARDLIQLSGFRPGEDIEIQFSGVRPGEKLFEELTASEEDADRTRHEKILVARVRPRSLEQVAALIDGLVTLGDGAEPGAYRARLAEVVPEFKSTAGELDARPAAEVVPLRRNG